METVLFRLKAASIHSRPRKAAQMHDNHTLTMARIQSLVLYLNKRNKFPKLEYLGYIYLSRCEGWAFL